MLTPEYLQGAPAELEALFLRLEEEVIKDICRRIAKEGRLTDSAADQAERLRDLGAGTDYIKRKISEYSKLSSEEVDRLFFDAAQTSDEFYRNVYDRANKEYTPYEYNDYFQQAVDAAVNQTKGELRNLTQSMGFSYRGSNGQVRFHTAAEAYRDCLDYAFIQTSTGMTDYNTAVRNATRRLTESGLQFVDYASGVRNHADVAVRRAVLTGLSQYTGKISERNAQELDTDIVEVSAHMGARPDHAEWQGRWYSLSGKSKKYPSLVQVTGYGTGAGLKGWNCRHDFYPVIPGISEPSYTEEELKNIDPPPFEYNGKTYTCYEATQRQRYMERAMRKTKREILAADSTGDKDKFTEKSVLLRRQREDYNKFSKAAGLLTQNERTQVGGFGHSQASKAAWAAKKAQTASGGSSVPASGGSSGVNVQNYLYSGLTNGGGNGTIKSIDVDDFNMMANVHEIKFEVSDLIANTIREYERKGGMYISDMHFGEFFDEDTGKPALMQVFQNHFGLTEININSAIMGGKTVAEIDNIIASTTVNLPRNLKEAIIHECGHAKAYYGKKAAEVKSMNDQIKDLGVEGISRIAKNDGAECIAEVEVLLSRNETVPEEAMTLYNKYVKGGRRK